MLKYTKILFRILILMTGTLFVIYCNEDINKSKLPLNKKFDKKTQSYAFILPQVEPLDKVEAISAKQCGKCHTQIYDEWSQSTHAGALADIQFQSEITKKKIPKWVCLNCHIPVQNQREYIITHLKDGDILKPISKKNPKFDPEMQKEAITCAVCHVRKDAKGKSYIIGAYKSKYAPHPYKKDKEFLQNICIRCHNPKGKGLTRSLVCWFDTEKELADSQDKVQEAFGSKQSCVSCHMPSEKRRAVPKMLNLPLRIGNQHHWVGGGIPKWYKDYDKLIERGYKPGLDIKIHEIGKIKPGEKKKIKITLKNARAGHHLPTADPERFISVFARVVDKSGKILQQKKLRIGQEWQWDPAKKMSDNRLKQGEERLWEPTLRIPKSIKGIKIHIIALHVKLTSENAKHMITAKGVDEKLFKNGQHYVNNAIDFYPFAGFVYKAEIDLQTESKKVYTLKELIELSKNEKGKKLGDRDY